MRGERRGLPDRCRAPQYGDTPLHYAALEGHAAVAGQLLAAKADVEAKDRVRGQGGCGTWIGKGRRAARFFVSFFLGSV